MYSSLTFLMNNATAYQYTLAGFHTGFFSGGGGGGHVPQVCLTTPTFVETTPAFAETTPI